MAFAESATGADGKSVASRSGAPSPAVQITDLPEGVIAKILGQCAPASSRCADENIARLD